MNPIIETVNHLGQVSLHFAWPMLWQSSLLILLLFGFDWALRKRVRAGVRYALWLLVLVKLVLPPTLAFPTGPAWWLLRPTPAPAQSPSPVVITYGEDTAVETPPQLSPLAMPAPQVHFSAAALTLMASAAASLGLLGLLLVRWRQIIREARDAEIAPAWLLDLLKEACRSAGVKRPVQLKLLGKPVSPAVCGLLRPLILIPRALLDRLSSSQIRAILQHELAHLRRGDVWVNCLQALLQIAYWWHPLLWFANARIRRLREEAVDDAVMLSLREDAETYAPTLLEVARLALHRPLASLGLVGILESQRSLRQRIERLVEFCPPTNSRLSFGSLMFLIAFGAFALPMGEGPGKPGPVQAVPPSVESSSPVPEPVAQSSIPRVVVGVNPNEDNTGNVQATAQPETPPFSTQPTFIDPQTNAVANPSTNGEEAPALVNRVFKVDPNFSLPSHAELSAENLRAFFTKLGVEMVPPKSFFVNDREGLIFVRATREDLDTIGHAIQTANAGSSEVTAKPAWRAMATNSSNYVATSTRRKAIFEKLDRIMLDDISFEHQPLSEVLSKLNEESKKHDPDGTGVQFILAPAKPAAGAAIAPSTGMPVGGSASPEVGAISILMPSTLRSVRLADVLHGIVGGADKPIRYSVEDYAVVFSASDGRKPLTLYVRIFKVDPNTFQTGLQRALGSEKTDSLSGSARSLFTKIGVDMSPPKSVFFNDREGSLMVRASLADLDIIETAVIALNAPPPPQLNIRAKWVAMPDQDANEFWKSLGPTTNVKSFTGILTEPQAAVTLHTLQGNPKAHLVTESSVTTLSGRQTEMQCVDLTTVVMGIDPKALTPPGVATNAFITKTVSLGPILDLNPSISPDGQTIHLGVIARINEFLGYQKPTNSVTIHINGKKRETIPPLPQFHVSSITNRVELPDGQTVVLGGLQSQEVKVLKDKVPVLGDVPLLGSLFRSESKSTNTQQLLVFLTPTIIDRAGNRIRQAKESASSK